MSLSLPPLNALRAFEASARHLSFKKASEELNVTPSAISQQVRNLEDNLGVVLFHRTPGNLSISQDGQRLLPSLEKAFKDISDTVKSIKGNNKSIVRVTSSPTFSAGWLSQKISIFQKKHPEISLQLHSSLDVVDMNADGYDIAIRTFLEKNNSKIIEKHEEDSLVFQELFSSEILIVCNPRLLKNKKGKKDFPKSTSELSDYNLIHFRNYNLWSVMLRYMGPDDLRAEEGIVCNSIENLLKSIQAGEGIGLIDRELFEHSIYKKNLEELFQEVTPGKLFFYLIFKKENINNEPISQFIKWLTEETKSFQGHYVFDQARKEKVAE